MIYRHMPILSFPQSSKFFVTTFPPLLYPTKEGFLSSLVARRLPCPQPPSLQTRTSGVSYFLVDVFPSCSMSTATATLAPNASQRGLLLSFLIPQVSLPTTPFVATSARRRGVSFGSRAPIPPLPRTRAGGMSVFFHAAKATPSPQARAEGFVSLPPRIQIPPPRPLRPRPSPPRPRPQCWRPCALQRCLRCPLTSLAPNANGGVCSLFFIYSLSIYWK